MYEFIKGIISNVYPKYIVIENNDIGYLIYVPNPYNFTVGKMEKIYLYQHIREDICALYGFSSYEEKELFIKLISVTGIGPKTALPILAASSVNDIISAISSGNVSFMKKFPGIGPKAAQQIILDLGGKIEIENNSIAHDELDDCREALIALGYNSKEVAKVLQKVDRTQQQNAIIKEALRYLSHI